MTATRTFSDTKQAIENNFANGKELTYRTITEYEELPKVDRKEYVLRAVATNETLMKHITAMEERIAKANEAIAQKDSHIGQLALELDGRIMEVKELKSSIWYKIYKIFK